MIKLIPNAAPNLAAFEAIGQVVAADYDTVLIPEVSRKVTELGRLNFLLYINTEIANFSIGAWLKDMLIGLQHISKWNRAAIVTDHDRVISFIQTFSFMMPGTFRGFKKDQLQEAMLWAAEQS